MWWRLIALLFGAGVLSACAEAPQKRDPERPPVVDEGMGGTEPGAAKSQKACTSLGLARDASAPDPDSKRDPETAELELTRANNLFTVGDYSGALAGYERAVSADPYAGLAHLGIAESHLYTDNDQAAMRDSLQRALTLLPTNPRAHLRAGEMAIEAGEKPRAEAHFRCALELRPDYGDAKKALAKYLYAEQRYTDAETLLAGDTSPEDIELASLAADILEAQKKFLEAAQRVEATAEWVKISAPLYRRAATLYESAGNLVAAKKARAEADKIDPPEKERNMRPLLKRKK